MSSEADWCTDFCLSCDRQTSDGPYCSHSCRMADLQKATPLSLDCTSNSTANSSSISLAWDPLSEPVSTSYSSPFADHNIYYSPVQVPPTQTFLPYRATADRPSKRSSISSISSASDTTYAGTPLSRRDRPSSWSSFNSGATTISIPVTEQPYGTTMAGNSISEEARGQLLAYESRFDHARRKRLQFTWHLPPGGY